MKTITNTNGKKALVFAETFEYEAYTQIKHLINFEAYKNSKVRIMPDAHAGKGCTVGTTMTITDKITPNLVGVDIGCGMLTVELSNTELDLETLDRIINEVIPSGFNVHTSKKRLPIYELHDLKCLKHVDATRARLSLGTLGGGNHFIEISKSEKTGKLYLIIHTGSRKLGGDTCKHYQNKAFQDVNEMKKVKSNLIAKLTKEGRTRDIAKELKNIKKSTTDKDLAFLTGQDFEDYIYDMRLVQGYAVANRKAIANILISKTEMIKTRSFETIHNYIDFSRMILRKGAVSAEKGEELLIPINMRDGSLLCVGKGNSEWNYSAPHGAGRLMSRRKAKESIQLEDFKSTMSGIHSSSVGESTLDEAPQAYKTLEEIRGAITDTVDVIDVLKPIYNFKAH